MKKLLWIGDAGVQTGYARATHETLNVLRHLYEVTVLGIQFRGDHPHPYPYPYSIYAAATNGDAFGVNRLIWMCDKVKPDVIVIQQDPWNIPAYMQQLAQFPEYANIPVVGSIPVDGKNCAGACLKGLALGIFWTDFAMKEARLGGYDGPATVIPLGVDTAIYKPMDRREARFRQGLDDYAFLVGNVNRNQPRKRWDLTIKYFAEWLMRSGVNDAYLLLHQAPTEDTGVVVKQLALYYHRLAVEAHRPSILDHIIYSAPKAWQGKSEEQMAELYNCLDVLITTTQGEGMGLTSLESMACAVAHLAPAWSALGDWAKDAAMLAPCTSTHIGPPYANVIGGIPDQEAFIDALDILYRDNGLRRRIAQLGYERAIEKRFRWSNIGEEWIKALEMMFVQQGMQVGV